MFQLSQLSQIPYITSPIGISIFIGLIIMFYLFLMSISVYLPPILLISVIVGLLVYQSQSRCIYVNPEIQQTSPPSTTTTTTTT